MSVIKITYNLGYTGNLLRKKKYYSSNILFVHLFLIPTHLMNIISFKISCILHTTANKGSMQDYNITMTQCIISLKLHYKISCFSITNQFEEPY